MITWRTAAVAAPAFSPEELKAIETISSPIQLKRL